jgi:NAD+ synthase (glutamine-hydrolysing)
VADFPGNVARVLAATRRAVVAGAELVVFPELCLCGYPPMDLLEQPAFIAANLDAIDAVQRNMPRGVGAVVGFVDRNPSAGGKLLTNSVALLSDGERLASQSKTLLPTYDVFDEARYFEPATKHEVVEFRGERLGLAICEDIWWENEPDPSARYLRDPVRECVAAGASLLVAPSASPYYLGKPQLRLRLLRQIASSYGIATVYANAVGGNDDLLFDGQSLVVGGNGTVLGAGKDFAEDVFVTDTRDGPAIEVPFAGRAPYAEVEAALAMGLRDFLRKTGHERVHVAVSGGIDSAVVAAVATRALGTAAVTGFSLPSMHSSAGSRADAETLCANLGIACHQINITDVYHSYMAALGEQLAGREADTTEENLQARIRGTLMMAYANKYGSMLLTTGNKSELATGYATLYGDMAGALAPIADLYKTQVYRLAAEINRASPVIPIETIEKPPSAELRPDQRDDQTLPAYEVLDEILARYINENQTPAQIIAAGHEPTVVDEVLHKVARAEHKRRQAPPVLKVSAKAFGPGRRLPIARAAYETKSGA